MPAPLSLDLRTRIATEIERDGDNLSAIARRFSVSKATVWRLAQKLANGESLEAKLPPGRLPILQRRHLNWLDGAIKKDPYVTSHELTERFNRHFRKFQVHRSTILRAMHALGFSFKKNSVRAAARQA